MPVCPVCGEHVDEFQKLPRPARDTPADNTSGFVTEDKCPDCGCWAPRV